MIKFPCPCGKYLFEVPQELAGSEVQCPECSRLNDIPTLSDLTSIDDDGTLRLSDTPRRKHDEPGTLRELMHVYAKEKFDDEGNPIDLRQAHDELGGTGANDIDEIPLASEAKTPIGFAPRYDPETGELLTPLDIKPEPPRKVMPFHQPPLAHMPVAVGVQPVGPGATPHDQHLANQKRTLTYARRGSPNASPLGSSLVREAPTLGQIPLRLLEPENLIAQFFLGAAIAVAFVVTVTALSLFVLAVGIPMCWMAVLAHFSNCIEDLGPGEADEVPRFMRDFAFFHDIWMPFVRMVFSMGCSFGPALAFLISTAGKLPDPFRYLGGAAMGIVGLIFFPGLALIFCATGHLGNLRPDRVIGTIGALGWSYIILVILAGAALISGISALVFFDFVMAALFSTSMLATPVALACFAVSLVAAVYIGHIACWSLGATYRRHVDQFPWVFEEHERIRAEDKRLKALAKIEQARARKTIQVPANAHR